MVHGCLYVWWLLLAVLNTTLAYETRAVHLVSNPCAQTLSCLVRVTNLSSYRNGNICWTFHMLIYLVKETLKISNRYNKCMI